MQTAICIIHFKFILHSTAGAVRISLTGLHWQTKLSQFFPVRNMLRGYALPCYATKLSKSYEVIITRVFINVFDISFLFFSIMKNRIMKKFKIAFSAR